MTEAERMCNAELPQLIRTDRRNIRRLVGREVTS